MTINESPPERLRQPEDPLRSQLRQLVEPEVALREQDVVTLACVFDKKVVFDHTLQQPTDLMEVPAPFIEQGTAFPQVVHEILARRWCQWFLWLEFARIDLEPGRKKSIA